MTGTTITIVNDVTSTREEFVLPCTPDEAFENCVTLGRAVDFCNLVDISELSRDIDDCDLLCAIRRTDDRVAVHWHLAPSGDPEHAREQLVVALFGNKSDGLEGGGV